MDDPDIAVVRQCILLLTLNLPPNLLGECHHTNIANRIPAPLLDHPAMPASNSDRYCNPTRKRIE